MSQRYLFVGLATSRLGRMCRRIRDLQFRKGFDLDPAGCRLLTRAAETRVNNAVGFLRNTTDFRLDPMTDRFKLVIGHVPGQDVGVIPASYTFPDSTIRIAPEYLMPLDDAAAESVLHELICVGIDWDDLLRNCTNQQRREVPDIVRAFIASELIHELYHDWQNRQSRFPSVERGKTLINRNRVAVGADWVGYLKSQGIDMEQHDREVAQAELECCQVQLLYWDSLYGPNPSHPLALAFAQLMEAAAHHYQALQAR